MSLLPRYLQVAHYLLEHKEWMGTHELAVIFNVSHQRMCHDFAILRCRTDLFECYEQQQKYRRGYKRLMKVMHIHPYEFGPRQHLQRKIDIEGRQPHGITWRDLVSGSWQQLAAR